MQTVRAREIEIPAFGMFVNRKIKIKCGNCSNVFNDKPVVTKNMISKCPYCEAINRLPITEN
jgi:Zn finger protein HypA/HybF involved in hydrogenase expression